MRLPMAKVTVVVLAAGSEALKCLDNHGNEVDWWFMCTSLLPSTT